MSVFLEFDWCCFFVLDFERVGGYSSKPFDKDVKLYPPAHFNFSKLISLLYLKYTPLSELRQATKIRQINRIYILFPKNFQTYPQAIIINRFVL